MSQNEEDELVFTKKKASNTVVDEEENDANIVEEEVNIDSDSSSSEDDSSDEESSSSSSDQEEIEPIQPPSKRTRSATRNGAKDTKVSTPPAVEADNKRSQPPRNRRQVNYKDLDNGVYNAPYDAADFEETPAPTTRSSSKAKASAAKEKTAPPKPASQPLSSRRKKAKILQDNEERRSALGLRNKQRKVNYTEQDDEFVEDIYEQEMILDEEDVEVDSPPPPPKPTKKTKQKKGKAKSKKRKVSDSESSESEEEELPVEVEEPQEKIVEKIIASRFMASQPGETEFLVKYKNMSYLHVAWIDRATLEGDKTTRQKLLNYEKKFGNLSQDDEYFDPDYLQVDRIIAKAEKIVNGKTKISYLVKWKSLPYEESTWEDASDVNDDDKIAQYIKFSKLPKQETPIPPNPDSWIVLEESPEYKNNNMLRPYQLEGLNFLSYTWNQGQNAILADEMGLGKTVQSVSIVNYLATQKKIRGPFLIIAPLSTIPHWKREFEGWTELNAVVYHGSAKSRDVIRKHEWTYNTSSSKSNNTNKIYKFNVLITTYEIIIADFSVLKNVHWKYIVVDEAHRLKNKSSKLAENLKNFYYDNILLLTGTPIQNNLEELWSLLNFVDPAKFNSINQFLKEYGDMKSSEQVNKLHTILKPYLLRRMKEHVEKSIAPKEETIIEVELTTIQKKYYRAIYEKNFTFLNKGTKGNNVPSLLNIMMELRKCCNHPYLIKGVEEDITSTFRSKEDLLKSLIHCSGKMVLIDKLLPKLKEGGHKILIFSQMVKVLDLLEEYLVSKSYAYERLDGTIRGNDRQAAIDRFSKPDSDRFVFLLSTRAGGLGINLTAADTVIIFDSDWNPQNDIQAQARAHRIGQKQLVKVYRLITRNTYEWQMFDRSSKKLGLDQAILTNVNSEFSDSKSNATRPSGLDKNVIDSLLKHGAYDLLSKDDDEASNKFCEEDIDQILERATTVVHKPGAEQESGLSSFSKASFASSTSAPELDINDPDFWRKLLPNAQDNNPLIQEAPRERKKVQRFGNDDLEDSEDLDSQDDQQEDEEYIQEQVPVQEVDKKRWLPVERLRFKKYLLTLGYGRWKEIQQRAKINRWTLPQIALYGKAFIKKYIAYTNKQDKEEEVFIAVDNSDERDKEISSEISTSSTTTATTTNSEETVTQDSKDKPLSESSNTETTATTTTTISSNVVGEENKEENDVAQQQQQKQEEEEEKQVEQVNKTEEQEEEPESFESDPSLNDSEFKEYMERNAKIHLKKLIELAVLGRVIRSVEDPLRDLVLPTTSVSLTDSLPTPDWSLDEDRSLLLGTYIHGYGAYDAMKNDPNLHFQKLYTQQTTDTTSAEVTTTTTGTLSEEQKVVEIKEQEPTIDIMDTINTDTDSIVAAITDAPISIDVPTTITSTTEPSTTTESTTTTTVVKESGPKTWPTAKALNLRTKKLIRVFIVDKRQKEKAEKTQQKQQEKEQKQKRKEEQAFEWSKREKLDFYRTLVNFGAPLIKGSTDYDWALVKEKASLKRKSVESIAAYYVKFLESCRQKLSNGSDSTSTEAAKDTSDQLTPAKAKKVIERIMLFSDVRTKLLTIEKFEKKFKHCHKSAYLPDWWIPGKHDKGLVEGVDKHGLEYEDICADPSLPFLEVFNQKLEKEKERAKRKKEKQLEKEKLKLQKEAAAVTTTTTTTTSTTIESIPSEPVTTTINDLPPLLKEEITDSNMQIDTLPTEPLSVEEAIPTKQESMEIESPQKTRTEEVLEEEEDNEEENKVKEEEGTTGATTTATTTSAEPQAEKEESSKPKKKKKSSKEKERSKAETLDFPKDHACLKRLYYLLEQVEKIKNRDEKKTQSSLKTFVTSADGSTVSVGEPGSEQQLDQQSEDSAVPTPKKRRTKKAKEEEEEVNEEDLKDKKPRKRKQDKGDKDKPKRRKSENAQPKKVNPLPLNSEGKVVFPIHLGVLSILSLGTVVYNKPGFHSTSYIWPIGFKSTRQYASMKDPERKTTYINEIIDNGDAPIFRVTAEDEMENPIDAPSPTAAWKTIIEKVNAVKAERTGKRMQTTVSGPEYFGFSHPSIAKLIQELPNSDKCLAYKAKEFVLNNQQQPKDSSPITTSITTTTTATTTAPIPPTTIPTFTAVNMNPTMSMSATVSPLPPPLPASLQIPPPKLGPTIIPPAKSQIKISDIIDINSDSKETPNYPIPQMFVNKIPLSMHGFNPFNDDDNDVMSDLPVNDILDHPKMPPRMMFNVGTMNYPQFITQPPPPMADPSKIQIQPIPPNNNGSQADNRKAHLNSLDNFFSSK